MRARPLFSPDAALGADELGRAEQAAFLAELAAHKQVETPLCIGLFGAAGSGKSFFLNQMLDAVREVGAGAARIGEASPFLPDVLTVRIDAAASPDAGAALMGGMVEALAAPYPKLAAETLHAGGDPIKAAKEAGETLNEARRRLDTERQSLEALRARQARLVETVLFEAAGSRVDAYARSNRSRIERALRSFGFGSADPITSYKDLVREASETGGPLAKVALGLRSLWAYPGQIRLIVYAVIFGLIAWGASALQADQQSWLGWIGGLSDKATPVTDWLQAHLPWLQSIHTAALLLALLALLWNIVRAVRFLQPIFKGVSLLRYDLDARNRDINSQLAHQTRRVDGLAAEAEAAASHADAAERRASVHKAAGLQDRPLPNGIDRRSDSVPAFFSTLDTAMRSVTSEAPRRIVVAIDGFDHLPGDAAAAFLKTAQRLLGAGFVTVIAADRGQLAAGFTETDPARASADLGRCVQLSYNLDWSGAGDDARSLFAKRLLDGAAAPFERSGGLAGFDPRHSTLDAPWRAGEAETVAALAPFAGESPRAVKQFVNVYRVARADPRLRDAASPVFTALALGLALDSYGFPGDLSALQSAAAGEGPRDSEVLQQALAAAHAASGEPVDLGRTRQGLDVARHYTARG